MRAVSLWALAALLLAGSCYQPDVGNGKLKCSLDDKCPDGYYCATDGTCWHDGTQPPGDAASDGSKDAYPYEERTDHGAFLEWFDEYDRRRAERSVAPAEHACVEEPAAPAVSM
jgi:hypothetical protein